MFVATYLSLTMVTVLSTSILGVGEGSQRKTVQLQLPKEDLEERPSSRTSTTATRRITTTTRATATTDNNNNNDTNVFALDSLQSVPQPRIVGGTDTTEERYPYFVSLLNVRGEHTCGGTLIAPDIVMSAAHCAPSIRYAQVGRWRRGRDGGGGSGGGNTENDDDYEEFDIMVDDDSMMMIHPNYESGTSFQHDVMLLRLARQSTHPYVRINTDAKRPENGGSNNGRSDDLRAIGLGYTLHANPHSAPLVLQEATLHYVTNVVCERAKDPNITETYAGLITDDMLCANDVLEGQDTCQGDSGGPLIMSSSSSSSSSSTTSTSHDDDILVGVTSWGFGCANPNFPGVYSRVSHHATWIRQQVCRRSVRPPSEYHCDDDDHGDVDGDSAAENHHGVHSVPVTLIIEFDDHPGDLSWSIRRRQTDTVLVNVEVGTYTSSQAQTQVREQVYLPSPSAHYILTIQDHYGDGLCCDVPGSYRLVLGRSSSDDAAFVVDSLVLVSGGGDFGFEEEHEFEVPENVDDYYVDENGDGGGEVGQNPDDNMVDLIKNGKIPLTIVVQLDSQPQEVGWMVDHLGTQVSEVIRIPAGIYTTPQMTVVRTVLLKLDELYFFNLYDLAGNGMKDGYGTCADHDEEVRV